MQLKLRTSVGRRLIVLVLAQTIIVVVLIVLALRALAMISDDIRYVYEFQLPGITETGTATKDAEELQRLITTHRTQAGFTSDAGAASVLVDRLNAFNNRYSEYWQAVHGNTADAVRFR